MSSLQELNKYYDPDSAVTDTLKLLVCLSSLDNPLEYLSTSCPDLVMQIEDPFRVFQNPIVVFDIDDTLISSIGDTLDLDQVIIVPQILKLFNRLKELRAQLYLVTARDTRYVKETWKELEQIGITKQEFGQKTYFCNSYYRESPQKISEWKKIVRQDIARKLKSPVLLTVGDQWSDLVQLKNQRMFKQLDEAFGVKHTPWILTTINDGISILGLKLRSMY
jgi:hypothetical protein